VCASHNVAYAMAEKYISLNEAHRRYGVALSTLRRKIKAGELSRVAGKDGGGVSLASLKKLYGDPQNGGERHPEREGSATPSEGGSAPRSEGVARGGALPPDHAAELAALRAERDTLKATLDHERTDREKERAAWADKYDRLAQSLIAIKGADYARDMVAAKLAGGSGEVIEGVTETPPRAKKPRTKPAARGAEPHTPTAQETEKEAPRAAGFVRGFFGKWWRGK
jgi:hypothetical protein